MDMTHEELIAAVREARSVEDLQALHRIIGPSQHEIELARHRLAEVDRLDPRCRWDESVPDLDTMRARERWQAVMAEQGRFENRYL